ncbi:type I-F CRISPR-associated endonuclease Cas1f [Methylomonas sp. MgM2]
MSKPQIKPRSILLSKRANVFYLEHVRVMQKDERVVYLTETGEAIERFFNIPERNTAFVLLGKGTSITDAAARRLADANVLVGFCGSGGSPLFSMADSVFLAPQSEYRPTEYMQAWVKAWFDENTRIEMGRRLLRQRMAWTLEAWSDNAELLKRKVAIPDVLLKRFENDIAAADGSQRLLLAEAQWAKALYAKLAEASKVAEFKREEGKGASETAADRINGFLDHGNYIAYGYAATVLNGLGISFSLPLLHGKTRRGALVFDVADLVKDAYVMPAAFLAGAEKLSQRDFRNALIEICQQEEILDRLFTFVAKLA